MIKKKVTIPQFKNAIIRPKSQEEELAPPSRNRCVDCGQPATHTDDLGFPLCDSCYQIFYAPLSIW